MTHETAGCMPLVENLTQGFGEHVCSIHDPRKVNQDDVFHESSMLHCKTSDFDMTRTIGGTIALAVDDPDR